MIHNRIDDVWRTIRDLRPEVLVVERFATSGRISAPGLETVEIVGSLRGLAWMLDIEYMRRTPAQRYPMMHEARTYMNALKVAHTDHQVDALAHLLVYEALERQGKV